MSTSVDSPVDGRSRRWRQHNADRRRELVESTLRAIRAHGARVTLDDIAAAAGTSKTVLYRHFGDRTGLYAAVVASVHAYLLDSLETPLSAASRMEPPALVAALTDAYLAVVDRDPEIYRFVVTRPEVASTVDDPVTSFTSGIGDQVAAALAGWLTRHGQDPGPAVSWGHGVVGFVWAIADEWLATGRRRPRTDIVDYVTRLFAPAFDHLRADATDHRSSR